MKEHLIAIGFAAALTLLPVAVRAASDPGFDACIATLRSELPQHPKVQPRTFDTYTRTAQDLRPLIENASRSQPEFQLPIWDYEARLVDRQRIDDGRAVLQREGPALTTSTKRYDVDAATAVAVFGVETDYGRIRGNYPVVDTTLSRACLNLKSNERKQHFFAALSLLQQGVVQPDDFKGSWAGAFGMTQFMPGTFLRYMDDGPGTPAADIVHSVPDALATTARFLQALGWTDGLRWGTEVKVPKPLAASAAGENDHACLLATTLAPPCRSVAQWANAGVAGIDGAALTGHRGEASTMPPTTRAALLMPAGAAGPAWLVTPNYQAVWRYNRADAYALAIGLLSDALRGEPPQRAAWPTDDPGLSRAEFASLQTLLIARGHCNVRPDGATGPLTAAAISDEEARLGWPTSGRGGRKLLVKLQGEAAGPSGCASSGTPAGAAPGTR